MRINRVTEIRNTEMPVYDIEVENEHCYYLDNGVLTHNTQETYSKTVVSGGTGILYSCDNAIVLGRQQEKEGTELLGYNFIMNIEKSRFVKEKSKLPLRVTFEGGIDKFSGLFDIALDVGFITSEKKGWYSVPSLQIENVRRSKLERSGTFWRSALEGGLKTLIEERYRLGEHVMLQGGDEEEAIDDDSDAVVDDE